MSRLSCRRGGRVWIAAFAIAAILSRASFGGAAELELQPGDHLCLVGNGQGERMQFGNSWEMLLYQRFPKHELAVRNLCFPGDEPFNRDRSLNFGSPDDHLAQSKADVILFFFGFNESFAGRAGLERFAADLERLVEETKTKNYSGKGPPQIVLVSPIAHEDLGDANISDGKAHNHDLKQYAEAMRRVAGKTGVGFADLFAPTFELFGRSERKLTINGVHLNEQGDRAVAPILDRALFGEPPAADTNAADEAAERQLRAAIADKNFHWWHRYRAVNGYSIYGTRGLAGSDGTYTNRDVMERERAILDQMCANRDRRIWQIVQGESVSETVDDDNTLPFFAPKTNVGGDNDPNAKAGKLGALDYLPAAEQLKFFELAPGYEINLFASEEDFPELANPVAMNFDGRGRMWVSTMPSYPQWQPKTKLDDKLLILEDRDRDGRADRCQVFAGGLHQPTGFELGYGGAFVAQQPDLLFLEDTDGDDKADRRERRLMGFDTADSHHGLSAFEWGPDGALYFQEGTFKQSQVESPYGPTRLGDAGVWRYEPRTERFGVHASLAFANPWGHVFDRWGQNFIADASPGFNYWATPITGRVEYPDKHPGGSRSEHLDWGGSRSNREYPPFLAKRIRPTSGCEFVSSRNFPPEAQGDLLVNNVIGDLAVLQHTIHDDGAGFGGREIRPLVLCKHGNFRPVDLQFGPDGALYIVDWHNALIGHLQHNLREPFRDHTHGRIWRVRFKDRPLVDPPAVAGEPIPKLLDLLKEPEDRTRYRARRELAERDTAEVAAALKRWIAGLDSSPDDYQRWLLEALWISQSHNVVDEALLKRLLESPEFRARAAATRVLCEWRGRVPTSLALLRERVRDPYLRVRLEAVRALSFFRTAEAFEAALGVLDFEMDHWLEYTLDETLRALEASLGRSALAAADEHAAHSRSAHAGPVGEHSDAAGHKHDAPPGPQPILFLDKPPKIVAYQLARLPTSQLLAIDRNVEETKFAAVYAAILARQGVSRQDRQAALDALCQLNRSSPAAELLAAIDASRQPSAAGPDLRHPAPNPNKPPYKPPAKPAAKPAPQERARKQDEVVRQLATMLLNQTTEELARHASDLQKAAGSPHATVRAVAVAGLISAGQAERTWKDAQKSSQGKLDFLAAVPLIVANEARIALRENTVSLLTQSQPVEVQRAAVAALAAIPSKQAETFRLAAERIERPELRSAAVAAMLRIPAQFRPAADARHVAGELVAHAESTPAAQRTSDEFLDAMQLADELLALLPVEEAREHRGRLREATVRVVRIGTVHEEMRYDTPYFAVEAARPVQVVLRNEDLMPHNLVLCRPGALREVAVAAATMSPQPDADGRAYVPDSPQVLFATRMVESHRQDALTFTAPKEPGEYPYVCTFPNHWMRMYGVMVVVDDLDAWLAKPSKPADPLGNARSVVRAWTVDDLAADLDGSRRGGSPEIGRKIFQEATCVLCHKLAGAGGAVGPELTDVFKRLKEDRVALLREVLDPSHKIEPKYALYNVVLDDGKILTGIVTGQNAETITVISNPEKPQPQVVARDEIDELVKTPASLMPKGLLDRFTREEILELLSLLEAGGAK